MTPVGWIVLGFAIDHAGWAMRRGLARQRTYPIAFRRQIAQEFLSGEVSLHGLAKLNNICRNLIRVCVEK
jgi:transposase-like protein